MNMLTISLAFGLCFSLGVIGGARVPPRVHNFTEPIYELTKILDGIWKGDHLSRFNDILTQYLTRSPTVYYRSNKSLGSAFSELFPKLLTTVSVSFSGLRQEYQERHLRLILSFSGLAGESDASLSAYFANVSKELGSHVATLDLVYEVDAQKCDTIPEHTSQINQLRRILTRRYRSTIHLGLGIHRSISRCTKQGYQLPQTELQFITVDFLAAVQFPESYQLFKKYFDHLVETTAAIHLQKKSSTLYRLNIETKPGNWTSSECLHYINHGYYALVAYFAKRLESQYYIQTVVQTSDDLFVETARQNELRSVADDFSKVVVPYLEEYSLDSRLRCDERLPELVDQVSEKFKSFMLSGGTWETFMKCEHSNNITITNRLNLSVMAHRDWDYRQLGNFINTWQILRGNQNKFFGQPLKGLLVHTNHLNYVKKLLAIRQDRLLEFMKDGTLGCIVNLGHLDSFINQDIIAETKTKCQLKEIPTIRVVLWEFKLNLDEHQAENSTYYVNSIQAKLHKIYIAQDRFFSSFPNTSVIVKLDAHNSSHHNHSPGPYCSPSCEEINAYYDAIMTWAKLHNVTMMLKQAFEWAPNINGFWDENLAMRNYPRSNYFHNDPCIRKSGKRLTNTTFSPEHIGTSLDMGILNRPLTPEEITVILKYAFSKFKRAEVLLRSNEDGWALVDALKKINRDPLDVRELLIGFHIADNNLASQLKKLKPLYETVVARLERENQRIFKAFQLQALHASGWRSSDNDLIKPEIYEELKRTSGNPFSFQVGLVVENCTSFLSSPLLTGNPSGQSFPGRLTYLVCEEESFSAEDVNNLEKVVPYLDNRWVLKRRLSKRMPNVKVYFRLNTTSSDRSSNGTKNFINLVQDLNEHAQLYSMNYLICHVFDHPEGKWNGWWRITNYTNLSDTSVYVEKEAEYFNRSSWKPGRPDSSTATNSRSTEAVNSSTGKPLAVIYAVIGSLSTLVVLLVVLMLWLKLRRKLRYLTDDEEREFRQGRPDDEHYQYTGPCDMPGYESLYVTMGFDEGFEIPKKKMKIDFRDILGSGNYGKVYRGSVDGVSVAVKVPHNGCSRHTFISMLHELKVLCHIGSHANVVTLVGAYTLEIQNGVIYIATELCTNGTLESYLRKKHRIWGTASYINEEKSERVNLVELVSFSKDIASGMNYIAGKLVIHGDLSTRNVLLTQNNACKIADFGLSRKVYEYQKYVKSNHQEPLPWRWMACESLKLMEFTTKSDVWSYAVTLWEVFSLGRVPYPGLSWRVDFIEELEQGLRLQKPKFATDEIYARMYECWQIDAKKRPSFEGLELYFQNLYNKLT